MNVRSAPRGAACQQPPLKNGATEGRAGTMKKRRRQILAPKLHHNLGLVYSLRVPLGGTNPRFAPPVTELVSLFGVVSDQTQQLDLSGPEPPHIRGPQNSSHSKVAIGPKVQSSINSPVP